MLFEFIQFFRLASQAFGGTLHSIFYGFGDRDIIAIVEVADDKTMATGTFVLSATGAFSKIETTPLLTTAEAMEAMSLAKATASAYTPATG